MHPLYSVKMDKELQRVLAISGIRLSSNKVLTNCKNYYHYKNQTANSKQNDLSSFNRKKQHILIENLFSDEYWRNFPTQIGVAMTKSGKGDTITHEFTIQG